MKEHDGVLATLLVVLLLFFWLRFLLQQYAPGWPLQRGETERGPPGHME